MLKLNAFTEFEQYIFSCSQRSHEISFGTKLSLPVKTYHTIYTFRSGQNGHHFADDAFKRIFLTENVRILINISLTFVPVGPIDNKLALVQVMAWSRTGDKPLHEPMLTQFIDAYFRREGG